MTPLERLNEIKKQADKAREYAKRESQKRRDAERWRQAFIEEEATINIECKCISSWEHGPLRAEFAKLLSAHAPAVFRRMELTAEAEQKRFLLEAHLLESQIEAAIAMPAEESAHPEEPTHTPRPGADSR